MLCLAKGILYLAKGILCLADGMLYLAKGILYLANGMLCLASGKLYLADVLDFIFCEIKKPSVGDGFLDLGGVKIYKKTT